MKTSLERINTPDGLTLEGLLFAPDAPTKQIVVFVHGSAGNFYENPFIDKFAAEFTKNGIALFTFNNRGAEFEKEKFNHLTNTWSTNYGMLHEDFTDCSIDILTAVEFVATRGYSSVALCGHSLGCNKVIHYALETNFTGPIVLLAPVDLSRHPFWGKQIRDGKHALDMFRYHTGKVVPEFAKFKNKILVQIGTADECYEQTDKQPCLDYLKSAFKNAKLTANLIPNANHGFDSAPSTVAQNITMFLMR